MHRVPNACKRHPVLATALAWLIVMTPVGMTAEAAFHLEYVDEPTKGLSFMPEVEGLRTLPAPRYKPLRAPKVAPRAPVRTVAPSSKAYEPPVRAYAAGSVRARVAAAWPGDDAKALCVVGRETGQTFNPLIRSRTGKYWGLWQADANFRATYGWGPSIEQQTKMAWRGFQARGWSPWPTARGC